MTPQLASEPLGNVWLLREPLDGAGKGRASPVLPEELSTAFRSGVVVSRWGWVPAGARLCLGDPVPLWLVQLQAQPLTSKRAWDSTTPIPALQNAVLEAE